jgi:hypothetical protein
MTDDEETPTVEEQIEEALTDSLNTAAEEIEDAVGSIRTLAGKVIDGTASDQVRDEYFEYLEQMFLSWINLVVDMFSDIGEPTDSERALEFYTLVDVSRAMGDMPTLTEQAIEEIKKQQAEEGNG